MNRNLIIGIAVIILVIGGGVAFMLLQNRPPREIREAANLVCNWVRLIDVEDDCEKQHLLSEYRDELQQCYDNLGEVPTDATGPEANQIYWITCLQEQNITWTAAQFEQENSE